MPVSQKELRSTNDIFDRIKESISNIDPVVFCEKNLTLDGRPFRITTNGYKPFVDIYRYIGLQAINKKAKPLILVKSRQVGATTAAANLAMYFMGCGMFGTNDRPPMRIIHAFPQLDMASAYAKIKLSPTVSQSRQVPLKSGKTHGIMESLLSPHMGGDTIAFKEFVNGNFVWVDSVGVDADRLRGRTADMMIFDEAQDMFRTAIFKGQQLLQQSQYGPTGKGVQLYLGTPKGKDSLYYEMWMNSTMHYYHLGCEACGKTFPLYTPGSDDWEKVWLEGFTEKCPHCEKKFDKEEEEGFQVICAHCGHVQDKRKAADRGKWYGKDPEGCEFMGFHINILYMPKFSRNDIISQKPGNSAIMDETTWQNEVLGEFYSGGGMAITADEIKTTCGDFDRKFRKIILPEECAQDKNVYMGCDWGKKVDISSLGKGERKTQTGGQSFSCVVVLKVEGPQLFSIQFATKLKSNDRSYKMEVLEQMMLNYNVKTAVGDVGYGYELMCDLNNKFGDTFLASEAGSGQVHGKVKFDEKDVPPTIRFEKDHYIEKMFNLFRAGAIRFPFGSWELVGWLVQHCASMIAKPVADRAGNVRIKYIKGNIPNDGFMALINAYLAYEYDITNGYKNLRQATMADPFERKGPLAIGAYIPGMRMTGG